MEIKQFRYKMYRGVNGGKPSDPGDFGIGEYWTSSRGQAKCYGVKKVIEKLFCFEKALWLTSTEAYDLAAKYGDNLHGSWEERLMVSKAITYDLMKKGIEGMVVFHHKHGFDHGKGFGRIEIVDYRVISNNPKPEEV